MATVRVKFRPSTQEGKEGVLYYQVIHGRVARQVNTKYRLYPHEWDGTKTEIIICPDIGESRRNYLVSLKDTLHKDVRRFKGIIARLDRTGQEYTTEEVVKRYLSPSDTGGFISFIRDVIRQMKHIGKPRTAERYSTVLNSFGRFLGDTEVQLDEVDSNLMVRYENFLKATGVCPNTSSYYMRGLRAIYNRAVEKELTVQRCPFKHVYTGIDKTVKRAVPLNVIRQIRDLDLTLNPAADYARDLFMFAFYTRGMSFIDMAFLRKKDLQNGIRSDRRQKTGQQLFIKWEKPMQEIVDKYDTSGSGYLLPIIRDATVDERRQYRNAIHLVNAKLRKLGEQLGLPIPLTSYVARHAWASIAKSKNIPVATISEAMGHDSENTTRIYLASLDTSVVDKANSIILKSL